MTKDKEEFKCMIYELVIGARNSEIYPIKESEEVVNEFEVGKYCSNAYEEVYKANQAICERLNVDEDEDVECIVSNLLGIAKHLSMKMYDYGEYYAKKTSDCNVDKIVYFYEKLDEERKVKFMRIIYSIQKLLNWIMFKTIELKN